MQTAERAQLKRIFDAAVELPQPERARFLDSHCADNCSMRGEIEKLLAADDAADGFLESSPFAAEINNFAEIRAQKYLGRQIGAYRIECEIGAGGMGTVFLATREIGDLTQKVAVKIVHQAAFSKEIIRRFLIERKILAELAHSGIARLIDAGETDENLPFLVMEYIDGVPLDDYCRDANLSIDERLQLFGKICAAVAYAHRRLIIHRDLKPSNILVTADGEPKLLDFGIAKLLSPDAESFQTATLMNLLTPAYAAPEQIRGESVTTATDVYSLGVILYELLAGARPFAFGSKNYQEIVRVICETEPPPPSVVSGKSANDQQTAAQNSPPTNEPPANSKFKIQNSKFLKGDLDNIILKALRKDPERRYQSVGQLSEDLERYRKGLPVSARPDTLRYRAAKFVERNRAAVISFGVILLLLVAGIFGTTWEAVRAARQQRAAEQRFAQVREIANNVIFKYHDAIANISGSTEVRKMMVEDATKYLDNLSEEAESDEQLQNELALAYAKLADVQGKTFYSNLGDTAGAIQNYDKAIKLLEDLRRKSPENAAVSNELRLIYASVSTLEVRRENWTRAAFYARQGLDLSLRLVELDPQNKEFQRLLARSYIADGDAVLFSEGYPKRIQNYRTADELLEKLLNADPSSETMRRTLALSHQRLGTALEEVGETAREKQADPKEIQADFAAALELHRQTLKIVEGLHEEFPLNEDYHRALGSTKMNVGSALARMGKGDESLPYFKQALEIMRDVSRPDPNNKEAARDVAEALEYSGMGFAAADRADQAAEYYRQSLETLEPLTVSDRTNFEFLGQISLTYNLLGDLLLKQNRRPQALAAYQAGLKFLEQSVNEQTNGQIGILFGDSCARLGKYYLQAGKTQDFAAAKNYLARSIEKLRELQAAGNLGENQKYKLDILNEQLKSVESHNDK